MSQFQVRLAPHGAEPSQPPRCIPAGHAGPEAVGVPHVRPHKGATGQTLARELRTMIEHDQSGSMGSMMSMSTSRAASRRVSMTDILLVIEILPEREAS